jgi:uncharacterized protein
MIHLEEWEKKFEQKIVTLDFGNDPAHDLAHFRRVVQSAKILAQEEKAVLEIVIPAAWLHDLVNVPKNDPQREHASRLSAVAALAYLRQDGYPEEYMEGIRHAIEAHSFSAQIEPKTVEAKVVQDADRLDGLGAIGIARCFSVAGLLLRAIYDSSDPFGHRRPLNDLEYTVDHFYVKLFKTAETLKTAAGRAEGLKRAEFMRQFIRKLAEEIGCSSGEIRA